MPTSTSVYFSTAADLDLRQWMLDEAMPEDGVKSQSAFFIKLLAEERARRMLDAADMPQDERQGRLFQKLDQMQNTLLASITALASAPVTVQVAAGVCGDAGSVRDVKADFSGLADKFD